MTLELPTGRDLSRNASLFAAFKAQRDAIDAVRGAAREEIQLAEQRADIPARPPARLP
jgi:hypothetical protein